MIRKGAQSGVVIIEDNRVDSRAPLVWLLSLIVGCQGLVLTVSAVLAVLNIGDGTLGLGAELFLAFLLAVGAIWLIVAAYGVVKGKAWTRAAVMVIELFAIVLSFNYFSTADWWYGIAFLVPAAVALVILFSPAVNAHITRREPER
ncbi:hypothetical protein DCC27_001375 [Auritidibacter sp. NML130574]|nr:hypothetical protein DCC27_001375 [Auritidibacter sp. NML130574]